jgi:hypothetical protein
VAGPFQRAHAGARQAGCTIRLNLALVDVNVTVVALPAGRADARVFVDPVCAARSAIKARVGVALLDINVTVFAGEPGDAGTNVTVDTVHATSPTEFLGVWPILWRLTRVRVALIDVNLAVDAVITGIAGASVVVGSERRARSLPQARPREALVDIDVAVVPGEAGLAHTRV